jgi:ABC-type arginine transport system ATPase subunit
MQAVSSCQEEKVEKELKEFRKDVGVAVFQYLKHWDSVDPPSITMPLQGPLKLDKFSHRWLTTHAKHIDECLYLANYLDIKPLVDLICAKKAERIQRMNVGDCKTAFRVEEKTPTVEKCCKDLPEDLQ